MKTINTLTKLFLLVAGFAVSSCKQEDTPLGLAVVSTNEITLFTKTTVTLDGKITSDGGSPIIEKGICFGTTTAPTIANNKITGGAGKGDFTATILDLSLNTTYYLRAYATNSVGTSYGNEVVFKTAGSDIYLAGGINNDAGYWKNGAYTALTTKNTGSFATVIATSGNDVYAAGYDGNFLVSWKNGVMTKLTDGSSHVFAAVDMEVVGSDVYIGGYEANSAGTEVAKIWKNGIATSLTSGTSDAEIFSVFVSGTDVYACGGEVKNGFFMAKYWKNGIATSLTDGTKTSFATSIFVKGSDVYVAGYERSTADILVARFWKNGVVTVLSNGAAHHVANDIFVTDKDVYSVGFNYNGSGTSGNALFWKNTSLTSLTNNTTFNTYGSATTIYISGSDVYVYGYSGDTNNLIWKNGVLLAPYDGNFPNTNLVAKMFIADK